MTALSHHFANKNELFVELIRTGWSRQIAGRLVPYEELDQRATVLRGDGFVVRAAALEDIITAFPGRDELLIEDLTEKEWQAFQEALAEQ